MNTQNEFFTIYYKTIENSALEIKVVNEIEDYLGRECALGGYFINIYTDDVLDVSRAAKILKKRGFEITEIPGIDRGAK